MTAATHLCKLTKTHHIASPRGKLPMQLYCQREKGASWGIVCAAKENLELKGQYHWLAGVCYIFPLALRPFPSSTTSKVNS